ncbi:MAG: adenylate kinase family protein [Candidatus Nanohaloarchaea archaeon]
MIVALTGTPGTGKTAVSEQLDGFRTVDLGDFCRTRELGEQREEFEVNIEEMREELEDYLENEEKMVIEGHLSHHCPADYCIVLRCHPEELRERLETRDYSREKIEENVEAEKLDSILIEAVENQENVIEVDTTGRDASEVAAEIRKKLEEGETGYGKVDWSGTI